MNNTLSSISIKNFTVFQDEKLAFAPNLNVIVGENGTGKSHLLKLAYTFLAVSAEAGKANGEPTKTMWQSQIAGKLDRVFRPDALGRLVRRRQGRERCEIEAFFADSKCNMAASFASQSKSEVVIEVLPKATLKKLPTFLPTRELLTLYPNFVPVYENYYLEFDETYRDTCVLLGAPAVKGSREKRVRVLLGPLEEAMGGRIVLDKSGRFYLHKAGWGTMEMHLVAEGLRKLAMLCRLIATGALLDSGYLFWDEPDSNLNPKLIKRVAVSILELCRNGVQVFIATHSLFLLRELEILLQGKRNKKLKTRFFGLSLPGEGPGLAQGDALSDLTSIASLDEELEQTDRFLEHA
jgi:predicted ATPase